jgi:hypothetical protein
MFLSFSDDAHRDWIILLAVLKRKILNVLASDQNSAIQV